MDVLILDGSYGEGGGQILRTALSLSAATARPFVSPAFVPVATIPGSCHDIFPP